jgi:CobQ-like glutamine amidotransferase family enzyme
LRVAVVYPDLLGTYGDGGNGEILGRRLAWRGIEATVLHAISSEPIPKADLYCLGGGEDGPQVLAAERLRQDSTFVGAVEDGAVVFAVCAGFQIVGQSFPGSNGEIHRGVGLLDIETTKGQGARAVGEVAVQVHSEFGVGQLVPTLSGFENHGGVTQLGSGVRPLGHVLAGVGNGGGDGTEGAMSGRVIGTYLHGPVLARNPALSDVLLRMALSGAILEPLDDSAEDELRRERLALL